MGARHTESIVSRIGRRYRDITFAVRSWEFGRKVLPRRKSDIFSMHMLRLKKPAVQGGLAACFEAAQCNIHPQGIFCDPNVL